MIKSRFFHEQKTCLMLSLIASLVICTFAIVIITFLVFWEYKTSRERPKSASYLRLKNIQGTTIVKFFSYHTVPNNTRKGFPETLNSYFLIWKYQKKLTCLWKKNFQRKVFGKKSRIVPKKPKGGPFGLPSTFGSIRKFCGLVGDSNPRSPAQTPEN